MPKETVIPLFEGRHDLGMLILRPSKPREYEAYFRTEPDQKERTIMLAFPPSAAWTEMCASTDDLRRFAYAILVAIGETILTK